MTFLSGEGHGDAAVMRARYHIVSQSDQQDKFATGKCPDWYNSAKTRSGRLQLSSCKVTFVFLIRL